MAAYCSIAGGTGFIENHLTHHLPATTHVVATACDNFTLGQIWHLEPLLGTARMKVVSGDFKYIEALKSAVSGCDHV